MTALTEHVRPPTPVGRALWNAAGMVFTGLLVFAPLNFGSTRAGGVEIITFGCATATVLWLAALLCGGPRPAVPVGAAICVASLGVAALPWITGLATATTAADFTQAHFARIVARWPYSIVWQTPASALAFTLALAAAVLPLINLARSRRWLLTFSVALTVTAVAIAALALLQNYTHATGIYWRNDGRMPGNFSGTFYHHTAAGAYFNTAWPLAVALTWLAWDRAGSTGVRWALAAAGLLGTILLLAAHGSHVSRLPQLLALVVAPFLLRSLPSRGRRFWFVIGGAVAVIALLVAVTGRTAEIGERWRLMFVDNPIVTDKVPPPVSAWPGLMRDDLFIPDPSPPGWLGDRGESWRTALRALAARPLTGHGPDGWMAAASRNTNDPFVRTFFQSLQFAYEDPLQFAVEWGVPAALAWWGLLVGAVVAVIRARTRPGPLPRLLGIAAACALAGVLLQALVDSPLQMPAISFNVIVLAALCWASGHRPTVVLP